MESIYADTAVSVTELKRNLVAVLAVVREKPVAVLNHNKIEAYLLSAKHYESLLARIRVLEEMQVKK